MINSKGQQARVDENRSDAGTTAVRTRKPAARSKPRKVRRRAKKTHSKRAPYLPAWLIAPLRALAETMTDRRDKSLLLVLADSGLRPPEVVGLSRGQIRVRMVEQPDGIVRAEGTGLLTQPRAEHGRRFVIEQRAVDALRDYLNFSRVRGDCHALFTDRGERMTTPALLALIEHWISLAKDQAD